jgi:hypothetical protein
MHFRLEAKKNVLAASPLHDCTSKGQVGENSESRNAPTWPRGDTRRGSFKIPKLCTPRSFCRRPALFVEGHFRGETPKCHFDETALMFLSKCRFGMQSRRCTLTKMPSCSDIILRACPLGVHNFGILNDPLRVSPLGHVGAFLLSGFSPPWPIEVQSCRVEAAKTFFFDSSRKRIFWPTRPFWPYNRFWAKGTKMQKRWA